MSKKRGNGQGTVYKVGDTYRAQVTRYEAGRRLTASRSGFRTKRDALEWCALNGRKAGFDSQKTFSDIWDEWSSIHLNTISYKKAVDYRRVYEESKRLHGKRFADLRVADFQSVADQKETYYGRKLFKTVYSLMSAYAIRNGYASVNYAELIELPPLIQPNKKAFSEEEVDLLWKHYEKEHDIFSGGALIMIYTGMRWGEISTIDPCDIHIEEGYMMGGIKTEAGRAGEILIVDRIKSVVAEIMIPKNRIAEYTSEGFRKGYNKVQAELGIDRHTVHECRHTTATMLALEGVHPATISAIMRHTNYSQTMQYTHVNRDEKLRNLSKILV